jgi:hypothetical protein
MRRVYVNVVTRLIIDVDEGIDVYDVLNEMHYAFEAYTPGAEIHDEELVDYEVTDSK